MGKSYGLCDFRIGKVGNLVFRKVENKNIISEKPKYYPVNSAWLTREEFKQYVLSLFDIAVPQLYLLDELPEEIFPYALLFIQNEDVTDVYLDKDGKRTQLHIGDGGKGFEPTQDQLLAMNSGITQPKREGYDLAVIGVDDLKTRMLVAEEGIGALETALDGKSDKNTTYTKTEVNELVDKLDTAIDQLDMEFSTLSDTKLDKRTAIGLGVYCHNGTTQGELSVHTSVPSSPSDTSILTEKAIKTYADSIKGDVNNKLDKRTDDGLWLYSHVGKSQGALHVNPVVEDVATDFDILTAKAVKTYVDSKDPLKWNYVGLLSAANGSTLTVKDDWRELLVICRVQEDSFYYNISQVMPKYAFTTGDPEGKQCFFGFYWSDYYTMKTRLGLSGSGDAQIIKNCYLRSDYWRIAGFYIYKR